MAAPASGAASHPRLWTHGPDAAPKRPAVARTAALNQLPPTPSQALPQRWCGSEVYGDETANQYDNGAFRFHALYVVPSDARVALDRVGSEIQRDIIEASALLERSYSRAIRFDMGTSCGPQHVDITTVRMRQTSQELRAVASDGTLFALVREAIAAAGFPLDGGGPTGLSTNFVAWLDGPSPQGICGQAELYADPRRSEDNLNNGGGKVALIYNAGTGQCGADVVRHEIGHMLGALQSQAPNAYDGAHCDDAYEDTMCESGPGKGRGARRNEYFDFGNDDYWSPPGGAPLPWWTLELSRFLCHEADCNVAPVVAAPQQVAQPEAPAAAPNPLMKPAPKAKPTPRGHAKPKPKARPKPKAKPKKRGSAKRGPRTLTRR